MKKTYSDDLSTGQVLAIGATLLAFLPVIITALALIRGWALTYLWSWFIVPVFGVPALTIAPAIGMMLVVSFFLTPVASNDKMTLLSAFVGQFIFLLLGWIVKSFM